MKQHLRPLILRTRGGHAMANILKRMDLPDTDPQHMTDAEAGEWYRLLQNLTEDARSDGRHDCQRNPMNAWRR